MPEGWSWINTDSSAAVSWDNQVAHAGSRSLRWDFNISPSQSFEGCEGDINQVDQSGIIRIDSQMLYEISLWTRSTTAGQLIASGTLKVTLYDGEQGEITSFRFGLPKSEEWGQSAITFGPEPAADLPWAEGTEFISVSIGNDFGKIDLDAPDQCDGESLNLWVDDVNVKLMKL